MISEEAVNRLIKSSRERKKRSLTIPEEWPPPKTIIISFEAYKLKCVVSRAMMSINGYVHVPKHHRFANRHYDKMSVDVHGGLTFSQRALDGGMWFGFDTCHSGDMMVHPMPSHPDGGIFMEGRIWTVDDVKIETTKLAKQLASTPRSARRQPST